MSDPVSSMDVEDVLSSIRRLVSEEAKSAGHPVGHLGESTSDLASADLHEAAEHAASDALNELVQAFEEEAGEGAISGIQPSDEITSEEDGAVFDSDPQVSFRHQAALSSRRSGEQKLVLTEALRVQDHAPDESIGSSEGDASEIKEYSATTTFHPHLRPVDDYEPDDSTIDGDDSGSGGFGSGGSGSGGVRSRAFEASPEDTLFDRAKRAMEAVKDSNAMERDSRSIEPESESDVSTAQETRNILDASARKALDNEDDASGFTGEGTKEPEYGSGVSAPEEVSEDATVSTSSPFSMDGVFSQNSTETEQNAGDLPEGDLSEAELNEPSTINFTDEDSVLDEDTLRDLVSDMVREELQGELGDRITRNVRKLVRREIQRALASREFE